MGISKDNRMLNTMKRHGVTLAIFAAGTTALSAAVYTLTKETIAVQAAIVQKKLLDQVIPSDLYDNDLAKECYLVTNEAILGNKQPRRLYLARKNGEPVAAALETTALDGYSGAIHLLVGTDFNGTVLGTRVTEHHETPGLGDKIETRISDWITYFSGKKIASDNDPKWAVKKTVVNLISLLEQQLRPEQSSMRLNVLLYLCNKFHNNYRIIHAVGTNNERYI